MDFWQTLWTVVFFASVALFVVLAVVVSIGGFRDIRYMFAQLKSSGEAADSPDSERVDGDG